MIIAPFIVLYLLGAALTLITLSLITSYDCRWMEESDRISMVHFVLLWPVMVPIELFICGVEALSTCIERLQKYFISKREKLEKSK